MFFRRVRGLFDFLMVALCLWAAWHHTPAGALVRRGAAWVFGVRSTARPLLAYYDGATGSGVRAPVFTPAAPPERPLSTEEALAQGAYLALMELEPSGRERALALAEELGVESTVLLDAKRGPAEVRKLLAALEQSFPDEESRVTALFAGREPARYARSRMAAMGAEPSLELLARQLPPGFEDATSAAAQALALSTAYGLGWPVSELARVSSPFGPRTHPLLKKKMFHRGVDLSVPTGTPVRAVAAGTVRRASEDAVNGRVLILDHGRGVTTAYCHNSELRVQVGQRVEHGDVIALSGNTGRSTGPHLHYQLELSARPVDPLRFRPRSRVQAVGGEP